MKLYVANISQGKKVVYLSCIRYLKKDGKFVLVPSSVSVKIDEFRNKVKSIRFPFILDVRFEKGIGAIIEPYAQKDKDRVQ